MQSERTARVGRVERVARAEPNRFPRRKPRPMVESEAPTACSTDELIKRVDRLEKKLADAKGAEVETADDDASADALAEAPAEAPAAAPTRDEMEFDQMVHSARARVPYHAHSWYSPTYIAHPGLQMVLPGLGVGGDGPLSDDGPRDLVMRDDLAKRHEWTMSQMASATRANVPWHAASWHSPWYDPSVATGDPGLQLALIPK